ncbi:MAG: hypothetical protein JSR64_10620 [Nitrospira sp.]|nr:hypothetical protein [Nitrospira sp.]
MAKNPSDTDSDIAKLGRMHKGRIGEDIIRAAFTIHGYQVVPLGIEHTPALTMNDKFIWGDPLFHVFRRSPDFLVVKRIKGELRRLFVEAKCWPSVKTPEEFYDQVRKTAVEKYLGRPVDEQGNPMTTDESEKWIEDDLTDKKRALHRSLPVMEDVRFMVIALGEVYFFRLGDIIRAGTGTDGTSGLKGPWRLGHSPTASDLKQLSPCDKEWFDADFQAINVFIKDNMPAIIAGCELCEKRAGMPTTP